MFEISKYKKSNVNFFIISPKNIEKPLKKLPKKENMSFNNVLVVVSKPPWGEGFFKN